MKNNVRLAIAEAEAKTKLGLLVWDEIPDQEETSEEEMNAFWSTPQGARETIFSIAALYSNENIGGDASEEEIIDVLEEILRDKKGEGYVTKEKVRKHWGI